MSEQLYAISLWQPWASLIFASHPEALLQRCKVHETRHWVPAEQGAIKRGQRLVIHAAQTTRGYRDMPEDLHELCSVAFGKACAYRGFLPLGAALGTVTLGDWYPADPMRAAHEDDLTSGGWGDGRFAWRLDAAELYPQPRPMKGRQGFWRVQWEAAAS